MAPINPSDVAFIAGAYGQPRVAGVPAGFEGVGEVVASGGGNYPDGLVGRRVSFFAGVSGSWAEYAVAEAQTCVPLRSGVSDEDGAALLVNPFSVWAMFDIVREEGPEAFVMTAGASQLCKLLTVLAAENGYRPVSLVRRDEQIEPLTELGASHVLNTESAEFTEELKTVLREERPRVLLDALSGPLAASVFAAMGRGSRWILYGGLDPRPASLPDPGAMIFRGKRIEGFWLTTWLAAGSGDRMLRASEAVQAMFINGTWTTDVAARVPLAEAHERVPGLLAGANQGKVMLVP
jgi:NADPH:quinone reductase-like Zn-dependent oxidoreductase